VGSRYIALALGAALAAFAAAPAPAQSIKTYRHIVIDGTRVKWGHPDAGTGAVVTYATVDAAVRFPAARNCKAMVPLAPTLARNGIGTARFEAELRAAFALWTSVADIRFEPAEPGRDADILIGAEAEPRGRAFTNIDYGTSSRAGIRSLTRSLICLNPDEHWKVGFDGNLEVYDLRYTLLHEIGHAIGLDHPAIASQLMDFRYLERFRAPQTGDVEGVVALYGPSRPAATAGRTPDASRRLANAKPPPRDIGG
jgi:predicted Zn-dependent protease